MPDKRPLSGIRIFELGIAIAGPFSTKYLAYFGAEVIKIESRLDPAGVRAGARWLNPEKIGRDVWADTGSNDYYAGKKSLGLNLKSKEGMDVAKRLLSKCDVFMSNLSAIAVKNLGLDYESVRAVKPDIIYAQISGFGATPDDPYFDFKTWGPNIAPLVGLDELTGWPDRAPSGSFVIAYPDYTNGLSGVVAILAALEHRDDTGEGQNIDLSQFEATASLAGHVWLDYEYNGNCETRQGNRLDWAAPQGVYPCRGDDRWVAISVLTEEEWPALCRIAGHPEWAEDDRFRTLQGRLSHHDELDGLISDWTRQHTASEVAEWLQMAGVAGYPALDTPGIANDPQLQARNFWDLAYHHRFGKDLVSGVGFQLPDSAGYNAWATAMVGEHTNYVLSEICNYSAAEIHEMIDKRIAFPMVSPEVRFKRPFLPWVRYLMPQLRWPEPE